MMALAMQRQRSASGHTWLAALWRSLSAPSLLRRCGCSSLLARLVAPQPAAPPAPSSLLWPGASTAARQRRRAAPPPHAFAPSLRECKCGRACLRAVLTQQVGSVDRYKMLELAERLHEEGLRQLETTASVEACATASGAAAEPAWDDDFGKLTQSFAARARQRIFWTHGELARLARQATGGAELEPAAAAAAAAPAC
ncbi:hypothetical protein HT031_002295 [Scenedesmus sp. PABB004]|nr:hypothetical protein HT031_002295 [Scenedesmus sp. PABB004]